MNILPIKLPDIGEGVTEVELVEWQVKLGDEIFEDDIIAAVMTDKAAVEIPSLYTGKVVWLGGDIGDSLAVGSDLVRIETDAQADHDDEPSSAQPEKLAAPADKAPRPSAASDPHNAPIPKAAPRLEGQAPLASPAVRARARAAGIELRQVVGTGSADRITQSDLEAVLASPASATTNVSGKSKREWTEEIHVIGLRRKIAERMTRANNRIPHITIVEEIDVTELEGLRTKMNADKGDKPKLTVLPFIIKTLCKAFESHSEMNAHYDDDKEIVMRYGAVHAGIATMTDNGLIVPVLRHVEASGPFELAGEIVRLSNATRTGKATHDELTGSTFTISSLGPLGALATTPIINYPEVAILGVNKMSVRPMWDGSQFVPRKVMNISVSFDHRVIDGWDAAVFVQKLKTLLESPALIFVDV